MIAQIKYGIILPEGDYENIREMLQNPSFEMLDLVFAGIEEDGFGIVPLLIYKPAGFSVGDDGIDIQNVAVGIDTRSILDADEKYIIASKMRKILDMADIRHLSVRPDWILFLSDEVKE